jgi:2-iminobutanoate/2-iminopropanoate deaminase
MNHPLVSYPSRPDTPISHLPFSPAVVVGDLIFVSGQASVDTQGKIISDSFEGEFHRSIENLRKVLEAAGSDLAHIVQTRNYVRDPADLPLFNQLYRTYFPSPNPARTTITHCLPDTLRFEIEAIAVRNPHLPPNPTPTP